MRLRLRLDRRPTAARAARAVLLGGGLVLAAGGVGAQEPEDEWWAGIEKMSPGLHVIEVDSVYRISGFTHDDILREMLRKGPGTDEIGVRLGLHLSQWRYSYQFGIDGGSRRCRLTEAQVLLRSTIVLPLWTNLTTAPPGIVQGWREFVRALDAHERGHRNRAKAQGVFLWQSLLGLEAADCEALQALARSAAEQVLADGREAQLAYDRDTGHGTTQGARWPPPPP